MEVYTQKGIYLGRTSEILMDMNKSKIYELILSETNPTMVDDSRSIGVPYRWVQTVSEIIVLRYFPGKIHVKYKPKRYRKKLRKLRVIKHRWGKHGTSRLPWESSRASKRSET